VRAVYEKNINPLMRRTGDQVEAPESGLDFIGGEDEPEDDQAERRSPAAASAPRGREQPASSSKRSSASFVTAGSCARSRPTRACLSLKAVAESDQTTFARRTRDGLTSKMADCASALSSFVTSVRVPKRSSGSVERADDPGLR